MLAPKNYFEIKFLMIYDQAVCFVFSFYSPMNLCLKFLEGKEVVGADG